MDSHPNPGTLDLSRLAIAAFLLVSARASAQPIPIGGEFAINSYTTGSQSTPQVGMADNGGFVVIWTSVGQDGDEAGLFGRKFQSNGTPFTEFPLNTFVTGNQFAASFDMNGNGDWAATWQSFHQLDTSSPFDVIGRATTTSGSMVLAEAAYAPLATEDSRAPAISRAEDDTFVVVWLDDSAGEIFGRRFAAFGAPLTGAMPLAAGERPSVAALPGGEFVIAYEAPDADSQGIFVARYSATGTVLAGPSPANSATAGTQSAPEIAANAAGECLVVWEDEQSNEVMARRVSTTGAFVGGVVTLSIPADGSVASPRVESAGPGAFVLAWESGFDIRAREVFRTGRPAAASFVANSTTGTQGDADVAAGSSAYIVVWSSSDGASGGVTGQRFQRQALLGDDFETGNLIGWSAAAP